MKQKMKTLKLTFPHYPNDLQPQNVKDAPMLHERIAFYRVESAGNTTEFPPYSYLTKKQVDELCAAAGWTVIIGPSPIEMNMTADQYVRTEEGTYNPANGHFVCTPCYIEIGMPSSPTGWIAP